MKDRIKQGLKAALIFAIIHFVVELFRGEYHFAEHWYFHLAFAFGGFISYGFIFYPKAKEANKQ